MKFVGCHHGAKLFRRACRFFSEADTLFRSSRWSASLSACVAPAFVQPNLSLVAAHVDVLLLLPVQVLDELDALLRMVLRRTLSWRQQPPLNSRGRVASASTGWAQSGGRCELPPGMAVRTSAPNASSGSPAWSRQCVSRRLGTAPELKATRRRRPNLPAAIACPLSSAPGMTSSRSSVCRAQHCTGHKACVAARCIAS